MSGIDNFAQAPVSSQDLPDQFAEAIAAVAHGQQLQLVTRTRSAPSPGHRGCGRGGGKGTFELIGNN